ncbi:uncharacterized protein ARMOST_21121 [Armillaria ostoyae]|uniref:Uncharacterized protein n=1 Tax=Armillaria ostoyae TaxID=47428 RepID=A0A284S9A1_ARMOS|nr:uncharacterized protein ARMOST_21121 [Armillaria ostoyae]
MSYSADEYILLSKDGKVLYSALLSDPSHQGPMVQALNMGFMLYPLPAVVHSEPVESELRFINVPFAMLDEVEVQPALMGKPVVVDPCYGYNLYRVSRGPEGEWAYKWGNDWREVAVWKDKGMFLINHRWAKKIATNLQSVALCVRDIQRHPFLRQITGVIGLTQISFGMAMAFVNPWRLTVGTGWDHTLMLGCLAFLWRFKLPLLPLRGGVFNLERSYDSHMLNLYLKQQGPVFILPTSSNYPHHLCLVHCNHATIQYYHNANIANLGRLNRDLRLEEIPNFGGTISAIRATNTSLQMVQMVPLDKEQPFIEEGSEVLMVYPRGWKLVPMEAKSVWEVLLVMYYMKEEIQFPANSPLSWQAARILAKAETNGTMKFIRELPARILYHFNRSSTCPTSRRQFGQKSWSGGSSEGRVDVGALDSSNSGPSDSVSTASSPSYHPKSPPSSCMELAAPAGPPRPHLVINRRTLGYDRLPYGGNGNVREEWGPNTEFQQDSNNWMAYAAPSLDLAKNPEGSCTLNPKLLEFGYLLTSKPSAAVLKAWANVDPANLSSVEELLKLCIAHHISFKLTIPASMISSFQKPVEHYSLNSRFAADVPFMPGFHKPRLDNHLGPAIMCANYRWKLSGVAARMNAGAFRALGGTMGWVVHVVTGSEAATKLLDGPSYIASHLFNFEVLPAMPGGKEYLIAEASTIEEQMALLGYVAADGRFYQEWTNYVDALMRERWEIIRQGEAEALTEEGWESYIARFNRRWGLESSYKFSEDDEDYGVDLFHMAYLTDWSAIALKDLVLPKEFQGYAGTN